MGESQPVSLFHDSAEYEERKKRPFKPPQVTLTELHAAIPKHLFVKSTLTSLFYILRTSVFMAAFYKIAAFADAWSNANLAGPEQRAWFIAAKCTVWATYWVFQGLAFTSFWCLSHEAGHGTLSSYSWVNHTIGFVLHTFLLTPYWAWRATHLAHHKAVGSIERDENFVPRNRTQYGLPPADKCKPVNYLELFEDTPIYALARLVAMQLFGFPAYLFFNTLGSPSYPPGTNHFSPSSPLFKREKASRIVLSNAGLVVMVAILTTYGYQAGFLNLVKYYLVPYLATNHWIVMLVYLHHTDPTIPHYYEKEWTWVRGALATVDRPLLGFFGRFFLHNVSHDHVAHHLFSNIPFYNQPQVTKLLKGVLKDDYNYDSTNTFRALYRSFTKCCFIEDDEGVAFYKDYNGVAQRSVAIS